MRILTFIEYYMPGFKGGGPSRTIANLVDRLGAEADFMIITRDRDLGDDAPYSDVDVGGWGQAGKARIFYADPSMLGLRAIGRLMRETEHDVLYLNSVFNPRMTIFPLIARRIGLAPRRRCIVAPRGELGGGALALKSVKKRWYLAWAKRIGLYADIIWQASSEAEAADIRSSFEAGHLRIVVAPNLTARSHGPQGGQLASAGAALKIVFLARIVPMKNLRFALDVLRRVKTPTEFHVFGPKEDANYWKACQKAIEKLPSHVRFFDRGEVQPDQVGETLSQFDLLFLPTLGENFGHVIAEAMQAGLPVIISDRTPWRGLAELGLGADISLDGTDAFIEALEQQYRLSAAERREQQSRVLNYANVIAQSAVGALDRHRTLFALPDRPVTQGVPPSRA